jgi:hypothetical protein
MRVFVREYVPLHAEVIEGETKAHRRPRPQVCTVTDAAAPGRLQFWLGHYHGLETATGTLTIKNAVIGTFTGTFVDQAFRKSTPAEYPLSTEQTQIAMVTTPTPPHLLA